MKATLVIGLVIERMRTMLSSVSGVPASSEAFPSTD